MCLGLEQDKPVTFLSTSGYKSLGKLQHGAGDNFPDNDGCNKNRKRFYKELGNKRRCRCRLVKSALCRNFERGSVLEPLTALQPCDTRSRGVPHLLACLASPQRLSRGRIQDGDAPSELFKSLRILSTGCYFLSVSTVYLSWCQGSYPGGRGWDAEFSLCFIHCSPVLSGHLNSQHIY